MAFSFQTQQRLNALQQLVQASGPMAPEFGTIANEVAQLQSGRLALGLCGPIELVSATKEKFEQAVGLNTMFAVKDLSSVEPIEPAAPRKSIAMCSLQYNGRTEMITLAEDAETVIGRDYQKRLFDDDSSWISRKHATIRLDGSLNPARWILTDHSLNGIFVNGQAMSGPVELSDGFSATFGGRADATGICVFVFQEHSPVAFTRSHGFAQCDLILCLARQGEDWQEIVVSLNQQAERCCPYAITVVVCPQPNDPLPISTDGVQALLKELGAPQADVLVLKPEGDPYRPLIDYVRSWHSKSSFVVEQRMNETLTNLFDYSIQGFDRLGRVLRDKERRLAQHKEDFQKKKDELDEIVRMSTNLVPTSTKRIRRLIQAEKEDIVNPLLVNGIPSICKTAVDKMGVIFFKDFLTHQSTLFLEPSNDVRLPQGQHREERQRLTVQEQKKLREDAHYALVRSASQPAAQWCAGVIGRLRTPGSELDIVHLLDASNRLIEASGTSRSSALKEADIQIFFDRATAEASRIVSIQLMEGQLWAPIHEDNFLAYSMKTVIRIAFSAIMLAVFLGTIIFQKVVNRQDILTNPITLFLLPVVVLAVWWSYKHNKVENRQLAIDQIKKTTTQYYTQVGVSVAQRHYVILEALVDALEAAFGTSIQKTLQAAQARAMELSGLIQQDNQQLEQAKREQMDLENRRLRITEVFAR